jgi:hypothetical protein
MGFSDRELLDAKISQTVPDDSATDVDTADEDAEGNAVPRRGEGHWGAGAPLTTSTAGRVRDFEDGCGICSPGRWPPARRAEQKSEAVTKIREALTGCLQKTDYRALLLKLATGKFEDCPFSDDLVQQARLALGNTVTSLLGPAACQEGEDGREEIFKNQKDPIEFQLLGRM